MLVTISYIICVVRMDIVHVVKVMLVYELINDNILTVAFRMVKKT